MSPEPRPDDPPATEPPAPRHIPVLLTEVVATLAPQPGEVFLDCTAGLGGHARAIARLLGPSGTVLLNDSDSTTLPLAADAVRRAVPGITVIELQGNYADLPRKLAERGLSADLVLADLGFSTAQMEDPARGLSFMRPGPLDMRLDPSGPVTAAQLLSSLPEPELGEILRDLGEEQAWRAIARKLVAARAQGPIDSTSRLAELVRSVVGTRGGQSRIDPATRTFQALRIAVNDELGSLRSLLEAVARTASVVGAPGAGRLPASGRHWLSPGARLGFISFHSLEDRLVKHSLAELARRRLVEQLTRKAVEPTEHERHANPKSRSAKFRAVRLVAPHERLV